MRHWDEDYHCVCERPDEGYNLPDQRAVFYIPDEDEDLEPETVTIRIERHYKECPQCGSYGYLDHCTFIVEGPKFIAHCRSENVAFDVVKAAFPTAEYDAERAREDRMHARGLEW